MTVSIGRLAPVAHLPLVLGVLRKLEVAQLIDTMIPPNPAHVLSNGRGVEALVLAILDGHHALYKVGRRLEERGMFPLLQPDLEPLSVHDTRLGQILDALFRAKLNQVFSAIALKALETYAISTPWMHQDTTTISLYGAYANVNDASTAPRPAYGHNKDGRGDLKQVLLSLGVSGDGGVPLRMGLRDGNTSDSVEVPQAIEESLALGLDGFKGIVADSKAYSQRTLGLCLEQQVGLVTLVPRTCGIRQEVEAWGQKQSSLPLLVDKPARRRRDAPRRWYGRSTTREVEGEYADGRLALAPVRFVAVYSTQLAQHQAEASGKGQVREAAVGAEHVAQVQQRRFACEADAEAAIAEYEGRMTGQRGRRPCRWRYHAVGYGVEAQWQRKPRTQRGRPRKDETVEPELVYCLHSNTKALSPPVSTFGWLVLATTVSAQTCDDAEIVRAYREQTTTVEPGFRWIKNPAAISPVWLEKRERIAALAMLTVVGLLVYSLIQRQVRQYLQQHQQAIPGNKGDTALPTAAVVFASFASVTQVHVDLDGIDVCQVHGWQVHHGLICQALGLDEFWYEGSVDQKNHLAKSRAP
ncbi:MAG: IS1634 family transposase [Candidatus Tectomicrobia bacterium]